MDKSDLVDLLDVVLERGYELERAPYADLYTLNASGIGIVKITAYRDRNPVVRVTSLNAQGIARWSVKLEPTTTLSMGFAVVNEAEAELNARAGRTVTTG